MNSTRVGIASTVLGFAVVLMMTACDDDDSTMPPPRDAGTDQNQNQSTLYERLGGKTGIAGAVHAVVTAELADPEIASYFFSQVKNPVPAGHPTATQIEACFTNLLANAAGGPEKYPSTPDDTSGFQCRDMTAAHTGLGIPNATFDKFVTIAAGVLKSAGVADADIAIVGGALNGTKAEVVQDRTRDGGPFIPRDGGP